jgi:hypothetical protein
VRVDEAAAPTASFADVAEQPSGGRVRTLSSVDDLAGLGVAINEFLSVWEGDGNRIVVCFDSVTTLLLNTDTERMFQFLHVLTRRVKGSGTALRYTLNPAADDDRTARTITSLFDHVVDDTDEPQ